MKTLGLFAGILVLLLILGLINPTVIVSFLMTVVMFVALLCVAWFLVKALAHTAAAVVIIVAIYVFVHGLMRINGM